MKIVLTYVDKMETAEEMAETLLQEKLAACVTFLPGKSKYWWKDKIETSHESIMFIKTKDELVEQIIARIKQIHHYELPVIDVINIEKINPEAKNWIEEVTK
ncbi:MAG: divalent-cation tolerance protein CutA [Nanoarchaeota archaeon]|nr:divalent-cation tolerance protein CutA [Nanoarchaeota archaeon]MBU1622240.1 divalent-cation tolerance protein CutA [Nanoarchaeota archaeon]